MGEYVFTNEEPFRAAFRRYVDAIGTSPNEALRSVGLRLNRRLMAFTPPKTQQQGMAAVGRDIRNAVRPLSEQWASKTFSKPSVRKRFRKIAAERDSAAMLAILQNFKGSGSRLFRNPQIVQFSPDQHRKMRDSRGRVRNETGLATFDVTEVNEYIKKVQANVGMAKGGWHAGLAALGGTSAEWISRHSRFGSFETSQGLNAYIQFSNASPWGKYHANAERTANAALGSITAELLSEIKRAEEKALAKSR